jgi:hypothetical protein
MNFIIERRANAESAWTATKHIIEADTANAALRAFGLRDAFTSDRVKIAVGGKSGRQYRAVNAAVSDAPLAALKRNVSGKVASGEAEAIVAVEAPYGLRKDGQPKRKPGRKVEADAKLTVTPKVTVKSADKPVYTREMRLANLAKGRAKRAANIAARKNGTVNAAPKKLTKAEREAVALLERLDALQAEVARLGVL